MNKIWTTGITVKNGEDGWVASCKWECGKFGQSGYMEGEITTRYYEPTITQAIDYVLEMINRLGIKRTDEIEIMKEELEFSLFYIEKEFIFKDTINIIKVEANRRGWKTYIN